MKQKFYSSEQTIYYYFIYLYICLLIYLAFCSSSWKKFNIILSAKCGLGWVGSQDKFFSGCPITSKNTVGQPVKNSVWGRGYCPRQRLRMTFSGLTMTYGKLAAITMGVAEEVVKVSRGRWDSLATERHVRVLRWLQLASVYHWAQKKSSRCCALTFPSSWY